jgi:homoserine dehydrogenase
MADTMNIALIGPGLVGSEFLSQIKQFKVIAIASSSKMTLSTSNLTSLDNAVPVNMQKFIAHCSASKPCVGVIT